MAIALTPLEVAALVGLDEGKVRKDVEHGIFDSPRFSLPALVYFRIMALLGFQVGVDDRRRIFGLVEEAMRRRTVPERVALGPIAELKVGAVAHEMEDKLDRFLHWKEKLIEDPNILGGEPVFPKSRTSVRRIGGLLLRGVPEAEILEDYASLKREDLELAKLFVEAYPKKGRPREAAPR
jgi:uncharacterized protein (DUF433 family)